MESGDPQGKRVAVVGGGLVGNAIWLLCDCICQCCKSIAWMWGECFS